MTMFEAVIYLFAFVGVPSIIYALIPRIEKAYMDS